MVRFIKQEAEEKANEIRVSAEEVGGAYSASATDAVKGSIRSDAVLSSFGACCHTRFVMFAGVQPGKAAATRARKGKDQEGVRAQGKPSGGQEKDVSCGGRWRAVACMHWCSSRARHPRIHKPATAHAVHAAPVWCGWRVSCSRPAIYALHQPAAAQGQQQQHYVSRDLLHRCLCRTLAIFVCFHSCSSR